MTPFEWVKRHYVNPEKHFYTSRKRMEKKRCQELQAGCMTSIISGERRGKEIISR